VVYKVLSSFNLHVFRSPNSLWLSRYQALKDIYFRCGAGVGKLLTYEFILLHEFLVFLLGQDLREAIRGRLRANPLDINVIRLNHLTKQSAVYINIRSFVWIRAMLFS
jgi:hypothetical protein